MSLGVILRMSLRVILRVCGRDIESDVGSEVESDIESDIGSAFIERQGGEDERCVENGGDRVGVSARVIIKRSRAVWPPGEAITPDMDYQDFWKTDSAKSSVLSLMHLCAFAVACLSVPLCDSFLVYHLCLYVPPSVPFYLCLFTSVRLFFDRNFGSNLRTVTFGKQTLRSRTLTGWSDSNGWPSLAMQQRWVAALPCLACTARSIQPDLALSYCGV